jgi:exonuclease SbcD
LARMQPDEIFRRLYKQKYDEEAPHEQLTAFGELMVPDSDPHSDGSAR